MLTPRKQLTRSKELCCSSPQHKYELAITDSGAENAFVATKTPVMKISRNAPTITVKVSNGQHAFSNRTNDQLNTTVKYFSMYYFRIP